MKFIVNLGQKVYAIVENAKTAETAKQIAKEESISADANMVTFELEDATVSDYAAIPIAQQEANAQTAAKRIQKMHHLALGMSAGGKRVFAGKAAELFVKQAKYMEDFEDSYQIPKSFVVYNPTYEALTAEQLRGYFAWRTKVRHGVVEPTALSCVYLYIYELINHIGVTDPMDGFAKLVFIWQEYRAIEARLDAYLVHWVKDYYICNNFDVSFASLIAGYELEDFYPGVVAGNANQLFDFERLCTLSRYKPEKSKFLTNDNIQIYIKSVLCAMENFGPLFALYGLSLQEQLEGQLERKDWYQPFRNAVYLPTPTISRRVQISPREIYEYQNGDWNYEGPSANNAATGAFVAYVMKQTEAVLRGVLGYKYKFATSRESMLSTAVTACATSPLSAVLHDPCLDAIIEEAIALSHDAFCKGQSLDTLPPHTVDCLQKIHQEPYVTFIKMRKMKPFSGIEIQFLAQAIYMENLTDNFASTQVNHLHSSIYASMTNDHLRVYLTWRTKIRAGGQDSTGWPNVHLYAYELINGIGAQGKEDTAAKLAALLLHPAAASRELQRKLSTLLKDYYICNDFEMDFASFAQKYHVEQCYPFIFLSLKVSSNWFALYSQISGYKIWESRFYCKETEPLLTACFDVVLAGVKRYLQIEGFVLEEVLIHRGAADRWWRPFYGVPCLPPTSTTNKKVVVCANESYQCKNNAWSSLARPLCDPLDTHIVGYILKRMESRIRELMQFKYKISSNNEVFIRSLPATAVQGKKRLVEVLQNPAFDSSIDDAVLDYFRTHQPSILGNAQPAFSEPVKVTIDMEQLDAIRKSAAENQQKLLVVHQEQQPALPQEIAFDAKQLDTIRKSAAENRQKLVVAYQEQQPALPQETQKPPLPTPATGAATGWEGLEEQLSASERQALCMIADGKDVAEKLHTLAQQNGGMMVEVMLETLNERAIDCIGDSLVESFDGKITIFEEYTNKVNRMLGRKKNNE